jgi:hypothetical protein
MLRPYTSRRTGVRQEKPHCGGPGPRSSTRFDCHGAEL